MVTDPLLYTINHVDGRVVRRQVDHVRTRLTETPPRPPEVTVPCFREVQTTKNMQNPQPSNTLQIILAEISPHYQVLKCLFPEIEGPEIVKLPVSSIPIPEA